MLIPAIICPFQNHNLDQDDFRLTMPDFTSSVLEKLLCCRLQGRAFFLSAGECGGVTGWVRVAGPAEAASIPMSSHLFAEASSHMLAVTPTAHW
jgi:hypothetical protein